ncbi:MAG: family 10 glycosylhydrolase [Clostridia bacterium]|nr:family 10 glycosylhydrolase [Clostridia bacterium]
MRKLLCMLLVLSLLCAVACGKDEGDTSSAPVDDSTAVSTPEADGNSSTVVDEGDLVEVPDITGMSPEEAEKTLKDAGFDVKVREKNYDDVPKGEVAEIDLKIGESYEKGTKCFLFISGGKTIAAQTLEYKQSALVENRPVLEQGANSDYQPTNYEYVKAAWLSQYDMETVYNSGSGQRPEEECRERAKMVLKGLKDLGINTLFVQVRPNGDSFYPSAYYCPSKYVVGMYGLDFTYDPFRIIVEEAHALNLSIHAWINPLRCMVASSVELINISYGLRKFYQEHMDDYVIKFEGNLYLNPGREEVRQLIIDGAAEIVRYYDVDGVHIDDYFYPTNMGFEYDKAAFLDQAEYTDPETFRKESLNKLISGLYAAVKAENPKALFGISPAGKPALVRGAYGDIDTWLSTEGYTDYIMPQLYWGLQLKNSQFDMLYVQWSNLVKVDSIRIIPGVTLEFASKGSTSEWINNKDVLKRCISFAEDYGNCSGFSIFSSSLILSHTSGERVPSTLEEVDNLMDFVKDKEDILLS